MTNRETIVDITELLFSLEEPSLEDLEKYELYSRASEEAVKLVGTLSPIRLLNKTNQLYEKYLLELK
jgi:hypothetical protein